MANHPAARNTDQTKATQAPKIHSAWLPAGVGITECEVPLLLFIGLYHRRTGLCPNYPEIQRAFGYRSKRTVFDKLERLRRFGLLHRPRVDARRAISLTERGALLCARIEALAPNQGQTRALSATESA
jgi:hypothetical protein